MSSKHKSHSLDKECLCPKCPLRFVCFTEERVFSDPIYQGLFEALMAQGKSREEALDEVTAEIKFRMNRPIEIGGGNGTIYPLPTTTPAITPNIQPDVQPWIVISEYSDTVNDKGEVQVNYTMHDGKEVSWLCK